MVIAKTEISIRNVALIGFMCTGKSAVGRELAKSLRMSFLELDEEIVKAAGKPISRIFAEDGERSFRRIEIQQVRLASMRRDTVISCGGGVVTCPENIQRLRRTCAVVLLTASTDVILKRNRAEIGKRPLLDCPNPALTVRRLLTKRENLYKSAADVEIDTSSMDVQTAVAEVQRRLGACGTG